MTIHAMGRDCWDGLAVSFRNVCDTQLGGHEGFSYAASGTNSLESHSRFHKTANSSKEPYVIINRPEAHQKTYRFLRKYLSAKHQQLNSVLLKFANSTYVSAWLRGCLLSVKRAEKLPRTKIRYYYCSRKRTSNATQPDKHANNKTDCRAFLRAATFFNHVFFSPQNQKPNQTR